MAVNTVTSLATAAAAGWNVQGSGSNWYAEKMVQAGGKIVCCASASAQLITGMQNNEIDQESHGSAGPKNSSFNGHI
jgi:hypothetical protein